MGPKFYNLEYFLINTSIKYSYNILPIQSLTSEYCGYYAVMFILFRSNHNTFFSFLKNFDKNTFVNDNEIKKIMI